MPSAGRQYRTEAPSTGAPDMRSFGRAVSAKGLVNPAGAGRTSPLEFAVVPGAAGANDDRPRSILSGSTTGAVQAGVGAFTNSLKAALDGRTNPPGRGRLGVLRPVENGINGRGASSARARRRRRMTTPTITATTIRAIAAPPAITMVR